MLLIPKILKTCLQYSFYINGFVAIPRLHWLSALIRICHLVWLSVDVVFMVYWLMNNGDTSIASLVGSASFIFNSLVNIIVILEAYLKSKHFDDMCRIQQEVEALLEEHLNVRVQLKMNYSFLAKRLLVILLCQLLCEVLKIWINCISNISPVFWHLLPITISLRTRYIQILVAIMLMNRRVVILRDCIWFMVKYNEPKSVLSSDIWQPYDPKDYENIKCMRLMYLRIWELYGNFNHLYGWSLLTLFVSSFFDIVCNCYWTYLAVYGRQIFHKYVMNGATSCSLASLVCVLFYYADASEKNTTFAYHENKCYKMAVLFMYLGYWIFGFSHFSHNRRIYSAFVILWYCEIGLVTYLTLINELFQPEQSSNGPVSIVIFLTHLLGHLIVLMESCCMFSNRVLLFEQFSHIRIKVEEELKENQKLSLSALRLGNIVIGVLMLLVGGHGILLWTTFTSQSAGNLLYWRSLQSFLALQFKTLEFLNGLLELTFYANIIRQTINDMGELNLKRIFKKFNKSPESRIVHVIPIDEDQRDEILLELLRETYNEIYATFQLYKEVYGWSLLATTTVYFVDFVFNFYWILVTILTQNWDIYEIFQNASFALMAFTLLSITCWYGEECDYESRFIGCLISKLSKPLGNKHYNDLVSEFSIQTLHQRFIITAKGFFSLNLSLLGKMVAAIMTYLVIMIQFMLTERNKSRIKGLPDITPVPIFSNSTKDFNV